MTFQHIGRQTMQTSIDAAREARKPTESSRLAKAALVAGITLATLAGAAIAAGQPQGQMPSDLATRDRDIHWPAGFEPEKADLFAHNEARLNASCDTVWRHIVDARAWPTWYPNAQDVTLLGNAEALAPDVRWRWTTFGLAIESRVHEFVSDRRLSWFGGAPGEAPAFYHSWLLKPDGNGCRAIMDEAGVGPGAAAFRKADEGRMHRGHALWLATLKWVSEGAKPARTASFQASNPSRGNRLSRPPNQGVRHHEFDR
jgi:uncharacterized protein YndB with AHSA1/START domain